MLGKNKQNILSANAKFTLQGGERYSPLDTEASLSHPDKEAQYDETRAYSQQYLNQQINVIPYTGTSGNIHIR